MQLGKPRLINDAPLRQLLGRLESEAEVLVRYGDSQTANIATAWTRELRQALDAAAREAIEVPLGELAVVQGRSPRTLRRQAKNGSVPGAYKSGNRWMMGALHAQGAK